MFMSEVNAFIRYSIGSMYEMTEKSVSYLANNCGKNNKKKLLEEKKIRKEST